MVQARKVTIRLFDGPLHAVESEVNGWLDGVEAKYNLVSIQYNYQAPEVRNDGGVLAPATHGICVVLTERLEVNQ